VNPDGQSSQIDIQWRLFSANSAMTDDFDVIASEARQSMDRFVPRDDGG
jgi:hypothetical protein